MAMRKEPDVGMILSEQEFCQRRLPLPHLRLQLLDGGRLRPDHEGPGMFNLCLQLCLLYIGFCIFYGPLQDRLLLAAEVWVVQLKAPLGGTLSELVEVGR